MKTSAPPPRIGLAVPFYAQHVEYDAVLNFARSAHRLGFDGLWLSDHLIVGPPPEQSRVWFDCPTLLAGLAHVVPGLTLGTDVIIAGHRNPIVAAKTLATLDVISGGRLVVGVGVGHDEHEFGVLGAEFARRGAVADECIEVWRAVWSAGPATFAGQHISIDEPELLPNTIQQPGPPVWVGGNSPSAIRRAARLGDGWHPLGIPPALYAEGAATLARLAKEAGRPAPTLSYSGFFGAITRENVDEATRMTLTGGVDQVVDDIGKLAEIGVSNIVFRLGRSELSNDEVLAELELLAAEVLPQVQR